MKKILFLVPLPFLWLSGCNSPMEHGEQPAYVMKIAKGYEAEWIGVTEEASKPPVPFVANFEFVNNGGSTIEEALRSLPKDYAGSVVFLADEETFISSDHGLLVVDLDDPKRSSFRATPSTLASIENNLAVANMDFSEFEVEAKRTGIFKGF